MSDYALEFNNIWKKFKRGEKYDSLRDLIPAMTKRVFSGNHRGELQAREFWALKDVSFQVKRGEALGIIGPNGAGKSTILKLLSGILRPNKGNIKVEGRLSALIEVGAGFHLDLTGRENIYLNGAILGMTREEVGRKFDEIIEFSGLEEFIDTPVKRYSSGMYARLGFSVAAHVDPEILLVDEVLSVGDLEFQQKCLNVMRNIIQKGKTIIFISHNMEAVGNLCKSCLFLKDGQLLRQGETLKVISEYVNSYIVDRKQMRMDSGGIIKDIKIFGEGKEELRMLPGSKVTVRVKVEILKKNYPVEIGYFLRSITNNQIVANFSTALGGVNINSSQLGVKEIVFDMNVNLRRGTYRFDIYIYDPTKGVFVDNVIFDRTMIVVEDSYARGIAFLNDRVHVDD